MEITEYRDTDGYRRFELLYEGIVLVLLDENAPKPFNSQLLAFKNLKLIWCLSPKTYENDDHIVNIWIKGKNLYAGSWSGFEHRFNYETGEIYDSRFTK